MADAYYSMRKYQEVLKKIEKIENDIETYQKKLKDSSKKADELEKKILKEKPELKGIIEKIRRKPATAYQHKEKLSDGKNWEEQDFDSMCYEFVFALEKTASIPADIKRLNVQLDKQKDIAEDIKKHIDKAFKLKDNLPKEFDQALENVRKQILTWFKNDQKQNIEGREKMLSLPLYWCFFTADKNTTNAKYFLKWAVSNGWSFDATKKRSDKEIIEDLKNTIEEKTFYSKGVEKAAEELSKSFQNLLAKQIAHEKSRNIEKETAEYFEMVRSQFIDEVSRYCAEIISVENAVVGMDGSINAIIHATNGDFYIRTIGAGGYNIQKFHYRVIIKPMK